MTKSWFILMGSIFMLILFLSQSSSSRAEANEDMRPSFASEADTVTLDVIVRDFLDNHPDFEGGISDHVTGLVGSTLGSDGKPYFVASDGSGSITNSATFYQWYNDVAGVNLATVLQLPLTETSPGSGMYVFENNSFFPIDGDLFGNQNRPHNYHFTLELHTFFTYQGGEVFQFTGDDDVWVYINNQLAVDLGGVHEAISGSVELDSLDLTIGATYPLDMFYAERHTTESRFRILTSIDVPTTPFLDLPVSYTNFEQAASGSNGGVGPGRVNSWFDHNLPNATRFVDCKLYPESEVGYHHDNRLTNYLGDSTSPPSNVCSCVLGSTCYDGHDGIDFRHSIDGDESVLAAAYGRVFDIVENCQVNGSCGGSGNRVWIDHGNCYATLYGHLDRLETGIANGKIVTAGQRIGIMGNTGFSTGVHLHFGLYKDPNCAGLWTDKVVVDPYGWLSTNTDPWAANTTQPLWIHPLGQQVNVDSSGGSISSPSGAYSANIPPGAVSDTITMELLAGPPVASPSAKLRSTGHTFRLRVFEWLISGQKANLPVSSVVLDKFAEPIEVMINYTDKDLIHLAEQQMSIYRWDASQSNWNQLQTTVSLGENLAVARTTETGSFTLQAPLICTEDSSEPDDNYDSASTILPDGTQVTRLFDVIQDEDWFKFYGTAGVLYQLDVIALTEGVETELEIFDTSGVMRLAVGDYHNDAASNRLLWKAADKGTYFVRISQGNESTYGCDSRYALKMKAVGPVFLPYIQH